jgi:hypothetical protein
MELLKNSSENRSWRGCPRFAAVTPAERYPCITAVTHRQNKKAFRLAYLKAEKKIFSHLPRDQRLMTID